MIHKSSKMQGEETNHSCEANSEPGIRLALGFAEKRITFCSFGGSLTHFKCIMHIHMLLKYAFHYTNNYGSSNLNLNLLQCTEGGSHTDT